MSCVILQPLSFARRWSTTLLTTTFGHCGKCHLGKIGGFFGFNQPVHESVQFILLVVQPYESHLAGRLVHRLSDNTIKRKKPGVMRFYLQEYLPPRTIFLHAKRKYGLQYLHRITEMCPQLGDLIAASETTQSASCGHFSASGGRCHVSHDY